MAFDRQQLGTKTAHPATAAETAVTTALEAAFSARVAHIFYPPPPYICSTHLRFSGSRNPLHPAYLPLHSASVMIERAPSGPRSPSETSQGGLPLLCSAVPANPAGNRPDGALPLGTDVTVRRPANQFNAAVVAFFSPLLTLVVPSDKTG